MSQHDYAKTLKSDESSLLVHYFLRPLAYPIAKGAHRLHISANALTVFSGICWMLSLVVFPAGVLCVAHWNAFVGLGNAGVLLLLIAAFLWTLGTILDVADGSLARLTGTSGPSGFFLDYVFHLLFKPCFFVSLGFGVFLVGSSPYGSLYNGICAGIAFFTIPLAAAANWSASSSSAEHVLCELQGKGKLSASLPARLWLGTNDSAETLEHKRHSGVVGILSSMVKECLSYYGQFVFFALLLVADVLLLLNDITKPAFLPCTTTAYTLLGIVFLFRIPVRIARDFVRMKAVDFQCEKAAKPKSARDE